MTERPKCKDCDGKGTYTGLNKVETCSKCEGSGVAKARTYDPKDVRVTWDGIDITNGMIGTETDAEFRERVAEKIDRVAGKVGRDFEALLGGAPRWKLVNDTVPADFEYIGSEAIQSYVPGDVRVTLNGVEVESGTNIDIRKGDVVRMEPRDNDSGLVYTGSGKPFGEDTDEGVGAKLDRWTKEEWGWASHELTPEQVKEAIRLMRETETTPAPPQRLVLAKSELEALNDLEPGVYYQIVIDLMDMVEPVRVARTASIVGLGFVGNGTNEAIAEAIRTGDDVLVRELGGGETEAWRYVSTDSTGRIHFK